MCMFRFAVEPDFLGQAVEGLRRLGVWGFNVTIPHKSTIIPFLDRISPEAELCGAVNTVCREGELLVGYNTDGIGFLASVREDLGHDPCGSSVLLLGAGGAARGAIAALAAAGAAHIVIANRTREKGVSLVESSKSFSLRCGLPFLPLLLKTWVHTSVKPIFLSIPHRLA